VNRSVQNSRNCRSSSPRLHCTTESDQTIALNVQVFWRYLTGKTNC
jgi:hypothetical protein